MSYKLHPSADAELSSAARYYAREASIKVARAFLAEFERVAGLIEENQQLGTRIVGFDGETVTQLKQRFEEAVDHYLWASKELGVEPQKPFSGKLLLRVPPELHARASVAAQVAGISLNQWVAKALEQATQN